MPRRDAYDVIVVVHAVVAVAAFGSVALSGVYGLSARRRTRPGALEEVRRYFARPPRAEAAVVTVGVLGIGAVLADPRGRGVGQLWTILALGLWLVASVLWGAVVRPAEAGLQRAAEQRSELAARALDRHGRRLARASAASSLIFAAALGLMIFQPR